MNEAPKHTPRPGDLPRKELAALANEAIATYGGPEVCKVFFKFTCPHCGARCTLQEPNALYEEGVCAGCNKSSPITVGGFSIKFKVGIDSRKN
jgi:hypothetical protein